MTIKIDGFFLMQGSFFQLLLLELKKKNARNRTEVQDGGFLFTHLESFQFPQIYFSIDLHYLDLIFM